MPARTYSAAVAKTASAPAPAPRSVRRSPAAARAVGTPRFAVPPVAAPQRPTATTNPAATAPTQVHDVLRAGGRPLEAGPRTDLERQLGHDLGRVRIHTGARAAASARAVGARAYAVGRHVVFGAGEFAPATQAGRQLLTHEVVHTLQQKQATATPAGTLRLAERHEHTEREADRIARTSAQTVAAPVPVTATPLQLAAQPAPAGGAARQRIEQAARLLQQTSAGPAMLNGLVESGTLIELRHTAGGATLFRVGNPLKQTDRHTWVRDDHTFEVHEVQATPGDATPRVVLEEEQSLGDLALNLFRGRQRLRWAADDPQVLAKSVPADDRTSAKAEYAKNMVKAVAWRNFEQLELKRALQMQGAAVTTALPLESEYRAAHQAAFLAAMAKHGTPGKAAGEATSASYRMIEETLTSGRLQTHLGENYPAHFARAWDEARAAWAQRHPQRALEGENRQRTENGINALAELVRRVDPRGKEADQAIELIDSFAMLHDATVQILFIHRAHGPLVELLGPFGFRIVEGVGIGGLQRERLEYALLNFRALKPAQRSLLRRDPSAASKFGINVFPTAEELQAKDRLVAIRTLPDGTQHTGTLAEFRWASDNNRINHILNQLAMIRSGGPGSLIGRVLGGEKGAALGAMVDAGLMVRAPLAARRQQRQQLQSLGGGTAAPQPRARLEPLAHRAPAPPRTPMPAPRPTQLAETEVVAANVRDRSAIQVQTPDVHQANWARFGGEGAAPAAYRHAGGTVYLNSESWLVAPATRAGIPPIRPGSGPAAPAPVAPAPAATPQSPAPARAPAAGRGQPDIGFDQTGLPDPFAQTPPAPAPAVGRPAVQRPTNATGPRPRSRFNPEVPPQPVSAERVQQLSRLARYTVDAARHQQAWELLGGRGTAPAAFISEKVIYLDPSRWPAP